MGIDEIAAGGSFDMTEAMRELAAAVVDLQRRVEKLEAGPAKVAPAAELGEPAAPRKARAK